MAEAKTKIQEVSERIKEILDETICILRRGEIPPKPIDWDWSYNTCMDLRDSLAASTTRRETPITSDITSINLQNLGVATIIDSGLALTKYPGKIGCLLRFNDDPNKAEYCIIDPEAGTVSRTGAKADITSSNATARINIDRKGKLCILTRYDGGVYSLEQDGSNCTKHGTCEAFPTNRGIRLVYVPEGGFIAYGEESTTRHMYRITEDYNVSLQMTWAATDYYFYSAIAMPDYWVFHQPQGIIMRMKRDLSSGTLVSRVTYGSYHSLASMTLCPLTRGEIFFGMTGHQYNGKKVIGYKVNSNDVVVSKMTAPERCEDTGCFLPTGEYFGHVNYSTSNVNYPPLNANQWFLYNYETDTFTNVGGTHDGTTSVSWRVTMLPTGKILSYRSTFGTDGCVHFKEHDFGFTQEQIPNSLLYGPYGFNCKY